MKRDIHTRDTPPLPSTRLSNGPYTTYNVVLNGLYQTTFASLKPGILHLKPVRSVNTSGSLSSLISNGSHLASVSTSGQRTSRGWQNQPTPFLAVEPGPPWPP